jgi:hypothetical protein
VRLRHTLKIINWSAAAVALLVLIIGKDRDYAWIGVVLLAALCLHFAIETVVLLRRGRFRRRLADTSEFKEHRPFQVKDLEEALSSDALVSGVSLPVILDGTVSGDAAHEAPLSGRKALAWRLVAEPLEGMGKVGGMVLPVDNRWGGMTLHDETGDLRVEGPGVLDGSSLVERVFSVETLRSELPQLAPHVVDGLGLKEGKESARTRIALREIALFPKDKVRVYGKARRAGAVTMVTGTDVLDDPGSLLVRAAVRPASSRFPRRTFQTITFALVSLVLFAGLAAFASSTLSSTMFAPGGLFDASRTGAVRLDMDGRQLRLTIADSHWSLDQGDSTRGFALTDGDTDFKASRTAQVTVQDVHSSQVELRNGETGYPRWDGAAWVVDAGTAGAAAATSTPPAAHTGPLYIRNLTGSPVTVRVLRPDGSPVIDTTWTFAAYESADDPRGHYLDVTGKGALPVSQDARVELVTKKGALRILPVAAAARWGTSSWLLELAPESLGGSGKLFVKNSGTSPVRIWVIGSDGHALYGEDPWSFEPGEGATENKGLRLTYDDKDIVMTGRETIRVETQALSTIYKGPLERLGTWRKGSWTIDMSRAGR